MSIGSIFGGKVKILGPLLTTLSKHCTIEVNTRSIFMARRQANLWANYRNPKELEENLTEKEQAFVEALIDQKLEPEAAFDAAGYTDNSNKRRPRALMLQRYLWKHIEKRIQSRISETTTLALNVLEDLMRTAESENVKLNAARDLLSRAGYDAVHMVKQETTIKEASEMTDQELDKAIQNLITDDKVVPLKSRK